MTNRLDALAAITLVGRENLFLELDKNIWYFIYIQDGGVKDFFRFSVSRDSNPIEYLLLNYNEFFISHYFIDDDIVKIITSDIPKEFITFSKGHNIKEYDIDAYISKNGIPKKWASLVYEFLKNNGKEILSCFQANDEAFFCLFNGNFEKISEEDGYKSVPTQNKFISHLKDWGFDMEEKS